MSKVYWSVFWIAAILINENLVRLGFNKIHNNS
jgi:hypothetical protein